MLRSLSLSLFFLGVLATPIIAHAQSRPSEGERGALVRVVSKWNDDCSASNRTAWDNMCDAWYDDITDDRSTPQGHGTRAWWGDGFYKNGNISDDDFVDPRQQSWGNDDLSDRADEPDALLVGLHGGELSSFGNDWFGAVRSDNSCGSGCDCTARQPDMILGDMDLEFLHLSSCFSMDWVDRDEWETTFDGLHQVNGFAGIMWISTTYNGRYSGFSDDAFDISIAESWVDNQYSDGFWTGGHDHCPVTRVAGNSSSEIDDRLWREEYDWTYSEPNSPSHFGTMWIGGCDPKEKGALPN